MPKRIRNSEERRAYQREWERKKYSNPEERKAYNERKAREHREFRKKNKEIMRERDRRDWLRKEYGVTLEWYEAKFKEQDGKCAICQQPERRIHWRSMKQAMLSVDHDHETNVPRGLLCALCNKDLFIVEYPKVFMDAALAYLAQYAH